MAAKTVNVGLIGTKFMGKAHSNAWQQVTRFFDPPLTPVMRTVVARDAAATAEFARRWGRQSSTTDRAIALADP